MCTLVRSGSDTNGGEGVGRKLWQMLVVGGGCSHGHRCRIRGGRMIQKFRLYAETGT